MSEKLVHVNNVMEKAVSADFDVERLVRIGTVAFRGKISKEIEDKRKTLADMEKKHEELGAKLEAAVEKYGKATYGAKLKKVASLINSSFDVAFEPDITACISTRGEKSTVSTQLVLREKLDDDDRRGQVIQMFTFTDDLTPELFELQDKLETSKQNIQDISQNIAQLEYQKTSGVRDFSETLEAGLYKKYLDTVPDGKEVVAVIDQLVNTYCSSKKLLKG